MINSIRARFLILLGASFLIVVTSLLLIFFREQTEILKRYQDKATSTAQFVFYAQQEVIRDTKSYLEAIAASGELQSNNDKSCSQFLAQQLSFQSQFVNLGAPAANGDLKCNATQLLQPVNVADRRYFQHSVTARQFGIGQYQFDRASQVNSVNFSLPVINTFNEVVRVAVAVVSLDWWNLSLARSNLPKQSIALIVDEFDQIVAHYPKSDKLLGQNIAKVFDFDTKFNTSPITQNVDGVIRVVVSRPLYEKASGDTVRLVIGVPISNDLQVAKLELSFNLLLVATVFSGIGLWVFHYLNAKVIKPINQLTRASNQLQLGQDPNLEIYTEDKNLHALATEFSSMTRARLRAELKVKDKAEELRQVFFALPDLYLRVDSHLNLIDFKCANLEPFKHAGNIIVGDDFTRGMTAENQALFKLRLLQTLNQSTLVTWEYKIQADNNADFQVKAIRLPNKSESILVIQDITENKALEKELRHAASVFENTSEFMLVLDANGRVVNVNPAFLEEVSVNKEQVIGRHFLDFNMLEENDISPYDIWQKLKLGQNWEGEARFRKSSGSLIHLWLALTPIFDSQSAVAEVSVIAKDITLFKELNKKTWQQANFDQLTGLANRTNLNRELHKKVAFHNKNNSQFYVLFIDLDDFKYVNDAFGHDCGDQLLKKLSERLLNIVPPGSMVARQGGDEFIILIDDNNHYKLLELAKRLINEIQTSVKLGNINAQVSASLGMSVYPSDGEDAEQLLKAADLAMYEAKKLGKNCFYRFTPEIQETAIKNAGIIDDLKRAVEKDELELYLQPISPILGGNKVKAEALLRWNHPVRGLISPDMFIPLAEQTNLISEIGDWVVEEALRIIAQLKRFFQKQVEISINLSPNQVKSLSENSLLKKLCTEPSKLNESLIIEITETTLMMDTCENFDLITSFRNSGMKVAIDDFGTGYSSLAYLRRYKIDFLKIDREFIRELPCSKDSAVICQSIINMAHSLGIRVIAEGVETEAQKLWLKRAGCDLIQGYLMSAPIPFTEFVQYIESTHCAQRAV